MENNIGNIGFPEPEISIRDPFEKFKRDFGNLEFRISFGTALPFVAVLAMFVMSYFDDSSYLAGLNEGTRIIIYVSVFLTQWPIFGLVYLATYLEKTFTKGIGLVKIRGVDFAWGMATLLVLGGVGAGLSYLFAQIGMPVAGDLQMLLPQELTGKILWFFVSFTAGFCEETLFRGYLMTRIRLLGKFKSWTVPVIISALAFGLPHAYQDLGGMLMISCLGVIFSVVYIRTKTLWPCIIAHFLLDFVNIFFPQ